jgi:hypothetical protein
MAEPRHLAPALDHASYFARVTRRDGPAIEEAMAGATLFTDGARLDGAVIEAAYAFDRPPLLKRLRDDRVLRMIDLQTLRFVGERYLETAALQRLPYVPATPITARTFSGVTARRLVRVGWNSLKTEGPISISHPPSRSLTATLTSGSITASSCYRNRAP